MPFDLILTFFIASSLLALAPGPDNIFVLTQSMLYGRRSAFLVILGLCSGLVVHTSLVVFGVAAIITASPFLYTFITLLGALYLLYLAYQLFRSDTKSIKLQNIKPLTPLALYQRGVIMNITNPKVTLFFLSFLPQFTHREYAYSITVQIIVLGVVFIVATLLNFGLIAYLSATFAKLFEDSPRFTHRLNSITAFIFITLALHLVIDL